MGTVIVLCYHAVSPTWAAPLSVTPQALEHQVWLLLSRGWRPATFADAALRPSTRRTFAITFDDAFASVRERAHPILSSMGVPATVFAPTAFMGGQQQLSWAGIDHWHGTEAAGELRAMCWQDLRELLDDGWEIGSHTRTHRHLPRLDDESLTEELVRSREDICARLGVSCETVAYPYGRADARVAGVARGAGYRAGAVLSRRLQALDPHRWPRIGIYHGDSSWRFQLKVHPGSRALRRTALWPADQPA